jgi:arsenate reductase
VKSVLFLCTGNSARSIMAEVMMNHLGSGRYRGYSAGSHPAGHVNPLAVETLREMGLRAEGLRSKSWDEFAAPGAPPIDFVVTVCDNAAGEMCPLWPGKPVKAHWGVEDPAAVQGSEAQRRAAFRQSAALLRQRIERFLETGAT